MQNETCLLIDNDEDDHEIFGLALQEANSHFRLVSAKNGIEGLDLLTTDDTFIPSLIFIDMNMPLMNANKPYLR